MSIATKTSTLPLDPHDAPRATPPRRADAEREAAAPAVHDAEPLDEVLDNPYDNLACTD